LHKRNEGKMTGQLPPLLAAVMACCIGCQAEYYARGLVEHNTAAGKLALLPYGSGSELAAFGEIDLHRRIRAKSGIEIDAWVLHSRSVNTELDGSPMERRGTVVIMHGLLDSKARYLFLGKLLANEGFDVVLVDLRAHGRSGGKYVTWGAREKLEIRDVMDTLVNEDVVGTPIYALGVSMGGCVAVQYAAIDERCKGVLAVAPPAGIEEIARHMYPLLGEKDLGEAVALAGEIGSFDPAEASAVDAARKLRCPLIVVHGKLDLVVPFEHSRAIYKAAAGPKRLFARPLAGHATILLGIEDWAIDYLDMLARDEVEGD